MLDKQLVDMSRALYADLDTPIALGVYLRQKYGEWDQYLVMRPDPKLYLDSSLGADKYYRDAQSIELLRKFPGIPLKGVNQKSRCKEVAVTGFWEAEQLCFHTNRRLQCFVDNFGFTPTTSRLVPFVDKVKTLIARILGPLPQGLQIRFGPGAIFESKGHQFAKSLTLADKFSLQFAVTGDAVDLLPFVYNTAWGRARLASDESTYLRVRGNRFTTVPKDATKDRGICIEPGVNVAMQLALGRLIRKRLHRYGIDLNHGQDLHRALARVGSLSNEIATLDLSSASDTIAKTLVQAMLPDEWFELLDCLRSPYTLIGGKWVRLEKFSSMGNGFTFELETLLFAAITSVACNGKIGSDVHVYGDDILYPSHAAREVVSALRYFGFVPNERKSFSTGPFRESCGGDFFAGFGVRPYYLDKAPNAPHEWISVVNGLRAASRVLGGKRFERARNRALAALPANVRRLRGPVALGDLVIHDVQHKWVVTERFGIRYVAVWRPVLKRIKLSRFSPEVQMAVALYGSAEGQVTNMLQLVTEAQQGIDKPCRVLRDAILVPRNGVSGYRQGRVAYS